MFRDHLAETSVEANKPHDFENDVSKQFNGEEEIDQAGARVEKL